MRSAHHKFGTLVTACQAAIRAAGLAWPALILFCLQLFLFIWFAIGLIDLFAYLLINLALCATFWCVGTPGGISRADRLIGGLQLLAWSVLAGPFGALLAIGFYLPRRRVAGAAEETYLGDGSNGALSRVERLHHALHDRRLRTGQAHGIRPMMDVILDGTQREKFAALRLIGKRFAPSAAPALKCAIGDKDAFVRVLGATIMAQLHGSYLKRIGECRAIAVEAPDAPDGWDKLGHAHLDYANSGLLELSRTDNELEQARVNFARVKQLGRIDNMICSQDGLIVPNNLLRWSAFDGA
jgi:hypothetical protein